MRRLATDHCVGYEIPGDCAPWEQDMHAICALTHYKRAHSWSSELLNAVQRACRAMDDERADEAAITAAVQAAVDVARTLARWRPHYGRDGDDSFLIPEPGDFSRLKRFGFAELLAGLVAMLRFAQSTPHMGTRAVYGSAARDVALEVARRISGLDRRD